MMINAVGQNLSTNQNRRNVSFKTRITPELEAFVKKNISDRLGNDSLIKTLEEISNDGQLGELCLRKGYQNYIYLKLCNQYYELCEQAKKIYNKVLNDPRSGGPVCQKTIKMYQEVTQFLKSDFIYDPLNPYKSGILVKKLDRSYYTYNYESRCRDYLVCAYEFDFEEALNPKKIKSIQKRVSDILNKYDLSQILKDMHAGNINRLDKGNERGLVSTLTSAKTGTVVKKILDNNGQLQKVIQYGEKTPLKQIGVDIVKITSLKNGNKKFAYFNKNGNNCLLDLTTHKKLGISDSSCPKGYESLLDSNGNFPKTIKNFIDNWRASKAMFG